ncbi:TPA: hypothetical protein DCQ22_00025 [Candidatus Nomurabacteria bacterium]|nr:hypothetical protein [Candidatus Nomurabacteria bacterium]
MQTGKPFKSYKKTILAKIYVQVLDPFSETPVGLILETNPKFPGKDIVDIWSEKEDVFFRRANRRQFDEGNIIVYAHPDETEQEPKIESYSDEKLTEIVNSKFLSLQSILNKVETEAVLHRMITIAKEQEKSVKIIGAIESRLSEINKLPVS